LKLTDFVAGGASASYGLSTAATGLNAGEAIAQGDLVVQAADGNAYWANDPASTFASWRPMLQASSAYGIVQGGAVPLTLSSINPPYGSSSTSAPQMRTTAVLTNGNIVVVWVTSTYQSNFSIISPTGSVVVPTTAIATTDNVNTGWNVCALTGGGFAVVYVNASVQYAYAVYSSAGALVGSYTVTGITATWGNPYCLVPLSNGSFAASFNASGGLYIGVLSVSCTVVSAFAVVGSTYTYSSLAALSGGGFVAYYAGSTAATWFTIYSNTGSVVVAQTASITPTTSVGGINAAGLSGGGFAVAAYATVSSTTGASVAIYNASGVLQGSIITLDPGFAPQLVPVLLAASQTDGGVFACWAGNVAQYGSYFRIAKFSASGVRVGSTFQTNLAPSTTANLLWTPDNGVMLFGFSGSASPYYIAVLYLNSSLSQPYPIASIGSSTTVPVAYANVFPAPSNLAIGNCFSILSTNMSGSPAATFNTYAFQVQQCAPIGVSNAAYAQGQTATVQVLGAAATRLTFAKPYAIDARSSYGQRMNLVGNLAIMNGIQGATPNRNIN